jgi:hypothetical protein
MPISVDERDALRNLVTFTRDELASAGHTDNRLASLNALTDQLIQEYVDTVNIEEAEVLALIEANPAAHDVWRQAQEQVWVRLTAAVPANELTLIFLNDDVRVRRLSRILPKLASLRWTFRLWQDSQP